MPPSRSAALTAGLLVVFAVLGVAALGAVADSLHGSPETMYVGARPLADATYHPGNDTVRLREADGRALARPAERYVRERCLDTATAAVRSVRGWRQAPAVSDVRTGEAAVVVRYDADVPDARERARRRLPDRVVVTMDDVPAADGPCRVPVRYVPGAASGG
ncbi:MAG: hypothetical protein ABEJ42_10475 [Halobacteriaceae archaeon]